MTIPGNLSERWLDSYADTDMGPIYMNTGSLTRWSQSFSSHCYYLTLLLPFSSHHYCSYSGDWPPSVPYSRNGESRVSRGEDGWQLGAEEVSVLFPATLTGLAFSVTATWSPLLLIWVGYFIAFIYFYFFVWEKRAFQKKRSTSNWVVLCNV